jgi:hypothetical protein
LYIKYAEVKEGLASTTDININHPKLTGEILTGSLEPMAVYLMNLLSFVRVERSNRRI